MLNKRKSKKAQEEMIGFALIMVIVLVLLLILLSLSLKSPQKQEVTDYEINNFIQSFLQYTTDCRDSADLEYFPVKKLITRCKNSENCLDNRNTCVVLNTILSRIIEESWKVEGKRPVKAYKLEILSNKEDFILFEKGNITKNYKGGMQSLPGKDIDIYFTAYY